MHVHGDVLVHDDCGYHHAAHDAHDAGVRDAGADGNAHGFGVVA